jgi:hypothetical protein
MKLFWALLAQEAAEELFGVQLKEIIAAVCGYPRFTVLIR